MKISHERHLISMIGQHTWRALDHCTHPQEWSTLQWQLKCLERQSIHSQRATLRTSRWSLEVQVKTRLCDLMWNRCEVPKSIRRGTLVEGKQHKTTQSKISERPHLLRARRHEQRGALNEAQTVRSLQRRVLTTRSSFDTSRLDLIKRMVCQILPWNSSSEINLRLWDMIVLRTIQEHAVTVILRDIQKARTLTTCFTKHKLM